MGAVSCSQMLAAKEVDFMIHGLVKFHLFGQELWITTTHVSILIVMIVLLVLALVVRKKMKHPQEFPTGWICSIIW